jgi:predicted DNA-binding transcriptional regulator AlpA
MSTSKPQRLLRWSDLRALGYGRCATYEKIKAGKFPAPIPLYEGGRAVGFPEREIAKHQRSMWLQGREQQMVRERKVIRKARG